MEMPVRNHPAAEPERPPTHRPGMFQWKPTVTPAPASSDTLQLFDGKHLSAAINPLGNVNSLTLCGALDLSQGNDNTA